MTTRVRFAVSKTTVLLGVVLVSLLIGGARARTTVPSPSEAGLPMGDLEEILAPIALYPDTLLANMLASAVYPGEVAAAAAYARRGGDPNRTADQGWEPSVVALVSVPEALYVLADNPEWTTALGQAYIVQSQDVMKAIQNLRTKARATGALQTTPQQTIVESGQTIIIESPSPEVVYVPSYNPSVVYVDDGYDSGDMFVAGAISFGVGVAVGAIFSDMDCDWYGGCVGWGRHGDVDIDRNVDIDVGEINVDRGDRTNTINNTNVQNRIGERPGATGRAGEKWAPNKSKVNTEQVRANAATGDLQKFRGTSTGASPAASIPKRDANSRPISGANRDARDVSRQARGDAARDRTASAGQTRAPSGTRTPDGPAASPARKPPVPSNAPSADGMADRAGREPSGFSPSSSGSRDSQRGASSRGQTSRQQQANRSSGGASRSPAGGSRGGGGRGGGGRR